MIPPKLSINLCCYNSEKFLEETLKSIGDQTFGDWELIVINDGSSDLTETIIERFRERGFPVSYFYQENRGLGYSRNRALELSRGDYVAFIDHDDIWLPEKLERQIEVFERRKDIDFIYTNYYIQKGVRRSVAYKASQPDGEVFDHFLRRYPVNVLTAAIRKNAVLGFEERFDAKLRLCEEYDLFMRLLYNARAAYIGEPLAVYRIHSDRASTRFIDGWPDEMEDIIGKYKRVLKGFEAKHGESLRYLYGKIGYYRARSAMARQDPRKARNFLKPHIGIDPRFLFLFVITFLPPVVWNKVVSMRSKGYFDEG
ncbi:MAG TPA: glycosyltransferase [Syntrophorhabdaceae bacterium]|nr:glycosyltransferase [Syntrophorhabdaceae bacterium]HQM82292.1 glycosyltransferase [Syntrophorhabdaceae bacterium]